MNLQVTSTAFAKGGSIPKQYTCDGADVSPPLKWFGVPDGAKSFALIADDPDAPSGTWVHWVLFNLPPSVTELGEGMEKSPVLPNGARQGRNDFHRTGYGGPCPPPGKPHRYCFKVYALDTMLDLKTDATKADLLKAMNDHVLAEGELMAAYQRKSMTKE